MSTLGAVQASDPSRLSSARAWLEKAAAAGDTNAMSNLGALLARNSVDLRGARFWLEKAAATGDANAMTSLGMLLFRVMDPPDLRAARSWLEKAAAAGRADAMANLGVMLGPAMISTGDNRHAGHSDVGTRAVTPRADALRVLLQRGGLRGSAKCGVSPLNESNQF